MILKHRFIMALLLTGILFSCNSNTKKKDISKINEALSPGLTFTDTDDLGEAVENFKSFVNVDRTLEVSNEIDHAKNAQSVNLELNSNKVFFIDNARYSIPLINENPLMALEFPIRIGFYQVGGKKFIVSRSQDYFIKRYGLNNSAALRSIGTLTETFLKQSAKTEFAQISPIDSLDNNGVITLNSSKSFEESVTSIQKTIESNEKLVLFESKDFTKDAEDIGAELKPLHLFVFGNPEVGTKLMQQNPNFSIDLPLKVLVEGNEDEVLIHFQDLSFTAKLHGEEFEDNLPETITENLKKMLSKAISEEESN